MTKLDGYQVCKRLKQDEKFRKIPVVIFSALGSKNEMELAEKFKADAYIVKPFEAQKLLETIKKLIGEKQ